MIFFSAKTPDGWRIPGIQEPWAEDEHDRYVQSGVYLLRGKEEKLLIDTGNWTLPEYDDGMEMFLTELLDNEKNERWSQIGQIPLYKIYVREGYDAAKRTVERLVAKS